ncbi:uncharacterized protein BDR25DRAFT_350615 [Lindgomyces ingoldianus]|uniref:Uncharacterized protein n=1 Tax=Lindgomyces ingoldianus TaxID=673940 RepID=A0ACB6R7R7_9PLEO|nr:uncharacterized protein BDR25DRAFT_350615 [Lindgomyces ingoldianus]KAF2475211.1 hypothetical protein BDR25DRAFT_350615 [Lindgomyces ingoldianus]
MRDPMLAVLVLGFLRTIIDSTGTHIYQQSQDKITQYIYHFIFILVAQKVNQDALDGNNEDEWILGQIMTAIIPLQTLVQLAMALHGIPILQFNSSIALSTR